jgi:hypothetical protein
LPIVFKILACFKPLFASQFFQTFKELNSSQLPGSKENLQKETWEAPGEKFKDCVLAESNGRLPM